MLFWKVKNLNPTQGFEHVKGYAGFAAGKPRVCSEDVRQKGFKPSRFQREKSYALQPEPLVSAT